MKDIKKYVVDAGQSLINQAEGEFDSVFYQRGAMISMILVEGLRVAQDHFNTKVVSADQLRWGLENMKLDDARLKALGAEGMLPPFATTCADHTGHSGAWMLQWNGTKFEKSSDLLQADRGEIDGLVEKAAKDYAAANQPWPASECKM
jgi:branched-chain amino acid transport system substrate-binding protein